LERVQDAVEVEKKHRAAMAGRVVFQMLHRRLALVFTTFFDRIVMTKWRRETGCRAVQRRQHRALAGAFDMFWDAVVQVRVNFEKIGKEHWEELKHDLEQERDNGKALAEAESARRRETCKRSVKRMLYIHLARAFDSFVDRVVQVRERKAQCKWFIKRIQLARLAAAFALFSGAIERVVAHREAVCKAMSRWRTPELREMFWHWIEYVDDTKQEAIKESLAVAKWQTMDDKAREDAPVPVHLSMTLGLDFSTAGSEGSDKREQVMRDVSEDLASASGLPPANFRIKDVSPGSIILDMQVMPDPSAPGAHLLAAEDLAEQAADPSSMLRSGNITSHATGVEVIPPTPQSIEVDRVDLAGLKEMADTVMRHNKIITYMKFFITF
jgi:hypothetical protein